MAFLDVLKPSLTLFGNARSEHLAYDAGTAVDYPSLQITKRIVSSSKSTTVLRMFT